VTFYNIIAKRNVPLKALLLSKVAGIAHKGINYSISNTKIKTLLSMKARFLLCENYFLKNTI